MWLIRKTTYFGGKLDSVSFYKRGCFEYAVFTSDPDSAPKFIRKIEAVQKMNELKNNDTNAVKISSYAVVNAFTPFAPSAEHGSAGAAILR